MLMLSQTKEPNSLKLYRKGGFIETHSGKRFYPLDPREKEVDLKDIAHALSMQVRFGGHCKFFYSVAQHSLAVYKMLERYNYPRKILLHGLLHDAEEAYMIDLPTPIKKDIPQYKSMAKNIQEIIIRSLNIPKLQEYEKDTIKYYDRLVGSYEASILMPCKTWNKENRNLSYKIEPESQYAVKEEYYETALMLLENFMSV
jgi:5'-deoxynucleotidase YfbR-like HD superfamily hydrolase